MIKILVLRKPRNSQFLEFLSYSIEATRLTSMTLEVLEDALNAILPFQENIAKKLEETQHSIRHLTV